MVRGNAVPQPCTKPADVRSPTFWSHHPVTVSSTVERLTSLRLRYLLWFTGLFFLMVSSTYVAVLPQFVIQLVCDTDFPAGTDCKSSEAVNRGTDRYVLMNTLYQAASLVSAPVIGGLADLYGRRRFLLFSVGASAADNFVCAFAPSFGVLIGAHTACGLMGGNIYVFIALAFAAGSDIYDGAIDGHTEGHSGKQEQNFRQEPEQGRGQDGAHSDAFGALEGAVFCGTLLGPIIGGEADAHWLGYRGTFATVGAVLSALLAVAWRLLPEYASSASMPSASRLVSAPPAAARLGANSTPGATLASNPPPAACSRACSALLRLLRQPWSPIGWVFTLGTHREVRKAALVLAFFWMPGKALFALQNSYVKAQFGWDSGTMGWFSACLSMCAALSSRYVIRLRSRRVCRPCAGAHATSGARRGVRRFASGSVLLCAGLCGVGASCIWFFIPRPTWYFVGGALYGGSCVLNPMFRGMIARASPAHMQALVLGSVGALEIFEQLTAPLLFRPIFDYVNGQGSPQQIFLAVGCTFLLSTIAVLLVYPITTRGVGNTDRQHKIVVATKESGQASSSKHPPPLRPHSVPLLDDS